jgi:recombination protein RecA
MDVRRKVIDKGGVNIGQNTTVKFVKNKVARPFTISEYQYFYDTGIDILADITSVAIEKGIIGRAGAWYYIGEDTKNPDLDQDGNELKWQGKDSLIQSLRQNPSLFVKIDEACRKTSVDLPLEEKNDDFLEEELFLELESLQENER